MEIIIAEDFKEKLENKGKKIKQNNIPIYQPMEELWDELGDTSDDSVFSHFQSRQLAYHFEGYEEVILTNDWRQKDNRNLIVENHWGLAGTEWGYLVGSKTEKDLFTGKFRVGRRYMEQYICAFDHEGYALFTDTFHPKGYLTVYAGEFELNKQFSVLYPVSSDVAMERIYKTFSKIPNLENLLWCQKITDGNYLDAWC